MHTDFVSGTFEIIFTSGSSNKDTKCVSLSIIDDDALEGDQIFHVILVSRDSAVITENFTASLRISDDDSLVLSLVRCIYLQKSLLQMWHCIYQAW